MNFRRMLLIVFATFAMPAAFSHAFMVVYAPKAYEPTKKTWVKTHNYLAETGASVKGTTYIAPLKGNGYKDKKHKNGARDTVVFIPDSVNFKQPIDIIFYFHGLGGFKERDFGVRVLRHTASINSAKNYVIVIPEMPWSKNTSTPRTRQGRVFNKKGVFGTFVESVRDILREHFHSECAPPVRCPAAAHILGDVILLGHSAGGSALMSISKYGGLHWLYESGEASSVKVIFSDASYGRWLDITWKSFKSHIYGTEFLILTRKWDKPYRHTERFLRKFKRTPINIKHIVFKRNITHAGIGDQSFKWVYFDEYSGCGEGERYEQPNE